MNQANTSTFHLPPHLQSPHPVDPDFDTDEDDGPPGYEPQHLPVLYIADAALAATTDEEQPPEFPVDALPDILRAMVENIGSVFRIPPAMAAMTGLAAVGAAAGKVFRVVGAVDGRESYPNLYTILIAPPACNKGAVAKAILDPFYEFQRFRQEQDRPRYAAVAAELESLAEQKSMILRQIRKAREAGESCERFQQELTKVIAKQQEISIEGKPKPLAPIVEGNATTAALERTLSLGDQAVLITNPESGSILRTLLGEYRSDRKADIDVYLSGFSCEEYGTSRISRASVSLRPALSMTLFVQPCLIADLLQRQEILERGLISRCLLVDSGITHSHDDGNARQLNPSLMEAWRQSLFSLLNLRFSSVAQLVQCSPEARDHFIQFYNHSIDKLRGARANTQSAFGRSRENAVRIALCMWLIEQNPQQPITLVHARNATRIVEWCEANTERLVRAASAQGLLKLKRRLEDLLIETMEKRMSVRDLCSSRGFKKEEIHQLVKGFPETFVMCIVPPGPTGGRPSRIIELAPKTIGPINPLPAR